MTQLSAKRYSEGGAQDMKQGRFNSTLDDTPTTFDDNKIVPWNLQIFQHLILERRTFYDNLVISLEVQRDGLYSSSHSNVIFFWDITWN